MLVHAQFLSFAVEAAVVAAGLFLFGYLMADAAVGRRDFDAVARCALAVPALVAYAFVLMVVHIATRGHLFSDPWVVRGITAAAFLSLAARRATHRPGRPRPDRAAVMAAGALVLLGLVLWANPVARTLPLAHTADTNWHMGWASQLMAGFSTPTAPIPGNVPNYYPWMFHALVAMVTSFTPGGRAYLALGPIQFLQVTGSVLGLFAVGRLVARTWRAGAGAAVFGALMGGFGFLAVRHLDVVLDPRADNALRYWGDLFFLRSYNPSFFNMVPPFPRDLAVTLLISFLLLLVVGLARRDVPALAGAGVLMGLIGLTGGEAFFVAGGMAVLLSMAPGGLSRRRVAAALFAPALLVYSFWLVPLAVSFVRLGGFVNTTVQAPVSLPPWAILASWGLLTPVGVYGAGRWLPRARRDTGARVMLALVVAAGGILIGSSAIPILLGQGFTSLGRAHRYWPLFGLGLALYGGLGGADLVERARRLHRGAAVAIAAVILVVAVPSPLIASLALPREVEPTSELTDALRGERNIFTVLAGEGRRRCIVAVARDRSFVIFAYTGYRAVMVQVGDEERHAGNLARIRWRDIYRTVLPDAVRMQDNFTLTSGDATPERWRAVAARYGVDLAAIKARQVADSPAFRGLDGVTVDNFVVFPLEPCP